jgi:hypothetical protein
MYALIRRLWLWFREFCWSLFFWPQDYEEAVRVMAGGEDD